MYVISTEKGRNICMKHDLRAQKIAKILYLQYSFFCKKKEGIKWKSQNSI